MFFKKSYHFETKKSTVTKCKNIVRKIANHNAWSEHNLNLYKENMVELYKEGSKYAADYADSFMKGKIANDILKRLK